MIFVTVGAQMPFDRMVRIVDAWAGSNDRRDVFAQIGPTQWRPSQIAFEPFLAPEEFSRRVEAADVIVSHAGMGSILSALRARKPILVFPRREALGETRSDHQVATAQRMAEAGWVTAALDEEQLGAALQRIAELAPPPRGIGPFAEPRLIETVRAFIQGTATDMGEGKTKAGSPHGDAACGRTEEL